MNISFFLILTPPSTNFPLNDSWVLPSQALKRSSTGDKWTLLPRLFFYYNFNGYSCSLVLFLYSGIQSGLSTRKMSCKKKLVIAYLSSVLYQRMAMLLSRVLPWSHHWSCTCLFNESGWIISGVWRDRRDVMFTGPPHWLHREHPVEVEAEACCDPPPGKGLYLWASHLA